jgi:phosphatidylinositol glycan class S
MSIIDSEGKHHVCSLVVISDLLIGRPTNQSSFLLPQWGSIFILNNEFNSSSLHLSYNDLKPVFRNFATQLAALLGVPPVPLGLNMEESSVLSDWQLDALLRRRAFQNVQGSQDTLHSIVKLVDQINNMPVGQVVRDDVLDALASLHEVHSTSNVILMKTVLKQCRPIAPP